VSSLDVQAAHAYWHGTEEGFADMGGYDDERPYTREEVNALENAAAFIAGRLHDPWATGSQKWQAIDSDRLRWLVYDAMLALQEQMLDEEDD